MDFKKKEIIDGRDIWDGKYPVSNVLASKMGVKMKNIKDYDLEALKQEFIEMGEKPFRAEQVFKWLYESKVTSFDEMTNL